MPKRDDFGLPVVPPVVEDPLKDKMKRKMEDAGVVSNADQMFDGMPCPKRDAPEVVKAVESSKADGVLKPSWSSVVKNGAAEEPISFDYCPMPFAKLCVKYNVGDPLPETIKVAVLDLKTQELSKDEFVDIEVSYPNRPMVSSGCKKLGHLVGACPSVKRVWIKKGGNVEAAEKPTADDQSVPPELAIPVVVEEVKSANVTPEAAVSNVQSHKVESPLNDNVLNEELPTESGDNIDTGGWTTVGGKSPGNGQGSFSKKLPVFTAISKSMSKAQTKKARKGVGRGSPKNK
ncbi:hypothetical protein ACET3Z_021316 [Daucus carota]